MVGREVCEGAESLHDRHSQQLRESNQFGLSDTQKQLLLVLMGTFPLIAGVRDAYSHKKAEKELIKQYRFMRGVLANARRLLDGSADPDFRRRVLKALGTAALEEDAEWILMHRERPLEHSGLQ